MRTTVTVDDDAQLLLEEAMRHTGQSFKVTLNQAIRKGLAEIVPAVAEEPFVVASQAMSLRAGIDPARLQQMSDEMDVEAFLDLGRELPRISKRAPEQVP